MDQHARAAGGLLVIATEMHASSRTDRQLAGRTARQGDPGAHQFLVSLEDELLHRLSTEKHSLLRARADANEAGELPPKYFAILRRAQRALERQHERERRKLLRTDLENDRVCRLAGLNPVFEVIDR